MVGELSGAADSILYLGCHFLDMEDTLAEGFRGYRQMSYAH